MAEKKKTVPDRDQTLINVLERMADQLQKQDSLLMEISDKQGDFSKEMTNADFHLSVQQRENDSAYSRIQEALSNYRSSMLSLVHEQDTIGVKLSDVIRLSDKTAYSLENTSQRLLALEERVKTQEKIVNDHFAHTLKNADTFPKEMGNLGQNVSRLHADTEKRLGQMHGETQRQLDKLKQETIRRLMVLDGIEAALNTLLIRTEPPEKKPLLIVRIFNAIDRFFRIKLPLIWKKIRVSRKDEL